MAKSLRSKKVQKNKTIKRQTTFGDVAAARERRIAEKLHNSAYDKILEAQEKPQSGDATSTREDSAAMDVEIAPGAAQAKPHITGLGTNLNKKRREERKAKSKRGSKRGRK